MECAHACKGLGIRPITGAEVSISGDDSHDNGVPAHLTLLAENPAGYQNVCRLLTVAHADTREDAQRSAGQPWVQRLLTTFGRERGRQRSPSPLLESSEYGCPNLCEPREWVQVFPWVE
jgi:DNA polymerase III alpha subunit